MSAHKFQILNLYKRVLKSHQALPVDLRHFGDVYVKSWFFFRDMLKTAEIHKKKPS